MFIEDWIVGDKEKSDKTKSSLKIYIIQISISPPIVYDNRRGAKVDNNDGSAELVEQAPLKPFTPSIEPELRYPLENGGHPLDIYHISM